MGAPLSSPPSEFGAKCVKTLAPEVAKRLQPLVNFLERRRLYGVKTAGSLCSDSGEAVLPQHPQVLGHSWLTYPELRLDDDDNLTRGVLLVQQHFEDPTADRVAEDIESFHGPIVAGLAYITQALILLGSSREEGFNSFRGDAKTGEHSRPGISS